MTYFSYMETLIESLKAVGSESDANYGDLRDVDAALKAVQRPFVLIDRARAAVLGWQAREPEIEALRAEIARLKNP